MRLQWYLHALDAIPWPTDAVRSPIDLSPCSAAALTCARTPYQISRRDIRAALPFDINATRVRCDGVLPSFRIDAAITATRIFPYAAQRCRLSMQLLDWMVPRYLSPLLQPDAGIPTGLRLLSQSLPKLTRQAIYRPSPRSSLLFPHHHRRAVEDARPAAPQSSLLPMGSSCAQGLCRTPKRAPFRRSPWTLPRDALPPPTDQHWPALTRKERSAAFHQDLRR